MAMSTTLFAVSAETLAHLKAKPDAITELDSKDSYSTYLWTSIPHFLAADEYLDGGDEDDGEDDDDDSDDRDEEVKAGASDDGAGDPELLADILNGTDSVNCSRLENGNFYTFEPADVVSLSAELARVDLGEIKLRVLEADLEEVCDGEVWEELEQQDLSEPEEVAKALADDLKRLKKFYADAAKKKLAIVGYTT